MLREKEELIRDVAIDIRKLSEPQKMLVVGIMQGMLIASEGKKSD